MKGNRNWTRLVREFGEDALVDRGVPVLLLIANGVDRANQSCFVIRELDLGIVLCQVQRSIQTD